MTMPSLKLEAFTLAARTSEPLDILGEECLVKLANTDTNGDAPPMSGPPLHRHSREDEWLYVLDGEVTVEVDGRRNVLSEGGSIFAPRGTAQTFQIFGPAGARILVMVTPGGFDQFFRALSALNKPLPAPDFARSEDHEGVRLGTARTAIVVSIAALYGD